MFQDETILLFKCFVIFNLFRPITFLQAVNILIRETICDTVKQKNAKYLLLNSELN